jgi:hypothetical protein
VFQQQFPQPKGKLRGEKKRNKIKIAKKQQKTHTSKRNFYILLDTI